MKKISIDFEVNVTLICTCLEVAEKYTVCVICRVMRALWNIQY